MDADLTIPRDLTEKEEIDLRKLLTSQLHITTLLQDEEDAEVLLDYAFDMIKDGDNIGQVVEELVQMELPVCGEEEGEKIGSVLTDFYNQMGTLEEAAAKEARAKEMEAKIAAHAAKKEQEEAEAEIRRKEEEEAAAAKVAEEEARLAAKSLKKAEEAAAAEARKRAIEEAEAAEAKRAEEEAKRAEEERIAAELAATKAEEDRLAAELEAKKKAEEERIVAELAAKKAEEDRIAAELEAKKKAEEERIAAKLAAKKTEEDRIAAELEAKKKEEEEMIALELEAEKRAEEEAKEDAAVVDEDASPVDATSNEPAADASSVDAVAITVAEEKKKAEEAAAAETILSEEAESLAEANRADEEAAAAAAQKKAELEERLARLESLAEEKKAEEESAAAAAAAQERVDEKEAALAAEQKAKVEAMLAAAKAQEKAEEEAALAAIKKVHKEAELAAAEKKAQEKKAAEVAATQAATESQPPSVDTGVIHAPMSRELADIRRGELEKIKQARSNIHMSLRGHWEERVKSNDQTHVSLVAAARAKIEKGALLTRYLELQEQSKMRGVVEEDEMMHEDSYQQDREVEPQGQNPVNTNYRKRNSRETAQEFEQRIKLHEQTHVVASTYDEKHHASNHFDAIDKHAFHQQQPVGFEDDWQSAEDALKERMESFRATSDKSPVRDKSKEFTTNKNKSKMSRRALPGGTNEAIPAPDVSLYGDALNAEGTFHANQERGDGYIPMPVQTSKQEPSKPLQTRRDESNESPQAPDVSMYGDAANAEGTFNANQERNDGFIPMPVQTSKQEASKPLQTRRDESNESPRAPDVSMYGHAANAEGTFNANQERNGGFIPMPVQTSKQEPSKSVETTEVDDSPVGEKPEEEMEVQTPAIGSAEGDTVGGISDENSDKIPDQLPVIKYGGAPETYEGDETTGENRAQKWHEQATKEGEALDIEEEGEEENVKDTEENAAEEDVGDDTTEPDAANNAEEDAEAAKKKAEEEAAAAAKKAEEKAARKEARKAAKRAARAAERAAAKKAEQEAAAAAAAMKATPSTDEFANPPLPDAKTGSCQGCIIC